MAIIIMDNCSWFVSVDFEPQEDVGYEEYISNVLWYDIDDISWIVLDEVSLFWENISIDAVKKWVESQLNFEKIYSIIQEWYRWYNKLYKSQLTESENIEEYGTNEFFWWKKEAYEDMLNFVKNLQK